MSPPVCLLAAWSVPSFLRRVLLGTDLADAGARLRRVSSADSLRLLLSGRLVCQAQRSSMTSAPWIHNSMSHRSAARGLMPLDRRTGACRLSAPRYRVCGRARLRRERSGPARCTPSAADGVCRFTGSSLPTPGRMVRAHRSCSRQGAAACRCDAPPCLKAARPATAYFGAPSRGISAPPPLHPPSRCWCRRYSTRRALPSTRSGSDRSCGRT